MTTTPQVDTGPPNAGPPNAGPPNAGPPNAEPPDAEPTDAGPTDAEPAESVAAAVAAVTRALTGPVTEADGRLLNAVMQQVQVRLDGQHGRTGRVTYDLTDDHPGQTGGRPGAQGGTRGGRPRGDVRTVHLEMPGSVGSALAELSDRTGKDMAFLMSTACWLLCTVVERLSAGRSVYDEDPASGQRRQMTLDWI